MSKICQITGKKAQIGCNVQREALTLTFSARSSTM